MPRRTPPASLPIRTVFPRPTWYPSRRRPGRRGPSWSLLGHPRRRMLALLRAFLSPVGYVEKGVNNPGGGGSPGHHRQVSTTVDVPLGPGRIVDLVGPLV